jgi:hypothetical protein
MHKKFQLIFAVFHLAIFPAAAQSGGSSRFVGTVQAFKPESAGIEIRMTDATAKVVTFAPGTIVQRVAPGETDLSRAETFSATDIALGDRVLVVLNPGSDEIRRIVVMSAADIQTRDEAIASEWRARGVSGIVVAVADGRIELKQRLRTGEEALVITANAATKIVRYGPDTVRFADAKPSPISAISPGDQVRALGRRTDGKGPLEAERIVFGTFQTKAGTVASVDAKAGKIQISEMGTGKSLTVRVEAESQLKIFGAPGGMGFGAVPGGNAQGGGPPAGGMPDLTRMIDGLPLGKLEDVTPGQVVIVSSTVGGRADEVAAITVVANAGMLIQLASMNARGPAGQSAPPGQAPDTGLGGFGGLNLSGIIP